MTTWERNAGAFKLQIASFYVQSQIYILLFELLAHNFSSVFSRKKLINESSSENFNIIYAGIQHPCDFDHKDKMEHAMRAHASFSEQRSHT